MSTEKDRSFQRHKNPSRRQFTPTAIYSRPYVQGQLQTHRDFWKDRVRKASEVSLDLGAHAAEVLSAITDCCELGRVVLAGQQAQERGATLNLPPEYLQGIQNARPYALGAYASSLLMQKLFNDQVANGSVFTKNKAAVVMDFPNFSQPDQPWAIHIDQTVFDQHFATPATNPQWYKDQDGLLLIRSVTPAEPTDTIRFDMQVDGVPENFGKMISLYPYITSSGATEL